MCIQVSLGTWAVWLTRRPTFQARGKLSHLAASPLIRGTSGSLEQFFNCCIFAKLSSRPGISLPLAEGKAEWEDLCFAQATQSMESL